jgi:hypothetical protein
VWEDAGADIIVIVTYSQVLRYAVPWRLTGHLETISGLAVSLRTSLISGLLYGTQFSPCLEAVDPGVQDVPPLA